MRGRQTARKPHKSEIEEGAVSRAVLGRMELSPPPLVVAFELSERRKSIVGDGLAGASAIIYLVELDGAARAEALRNAGALLTNNTAKDLRPGEAALLHSARLIQFTIAGVDFIPLNELPEGRPLSPARKVPILFRLDPDLVVQLRASGPGYQTRVNALLREAVLGPKTRKATKAAKATKAKPARKASRLKPNAKGKAAAGLEWLRSQRRKAEAAKRRQQRAKART